MMLPGIILALTVGGIWWQAWILFALFFSGSFLIFKYLQKSNPKLLARRMSKDIESKKDRKTIFWYRATIVVMLLACGVDHRFQLAPAGPEWFAALLPVFIATLIVPFFVYKYNPLADEVLVLHADHRIAWGGPYKIVRHPMYASGIVMLAIIPLMSGSFLGVPFSVVCIAISVARTAREDRFLLKNLKGYKEYARIVRKRLIPFIW